MKKRTSSVNTIITIIALMLFARVIGLLREAFTASTFGASMETDAYNASVLLTINLFLGIGSALATTLVPRVVKAKTEVNGDNKINQLLTWTMSLVVLISICYYVAAPAIVSFASNFAEFENAQLTITFVRLLTPGIVFIAFTYFLQGLHHANQSFIFPALASFPANLIFFVFIFTFVGQYGLFGLAVCVVLGWALQCLFLLTPAVKNRMHRFKPNFVYSDEVRIFFIALVPITLVTLMHTFVLMYDNNVSSSLGEGYITAITYGNTLFRAIVQTTVYGITAVMFPQFNKKFVENNHDGLIQSIVNVLRSVSLLLIPMSIGLIILGDEVIRFMFQRGLFDAQGSAATITVFLRYTSFMIAFGIIDVLNKASFTVGDTKKPIMITTIVIMMNIIATNIFVPVMGFDGVATGTAVAYYTGAFVSLTLFYKKGHMRGIKEMMSTVFKALGSAVIMGTVVYLVKGLLIGGSDSDLWRLLVIAIGSVLGVIVYTLMLILLREDLVTHNIKIWLKRRGIMGNGH